MNKRILTWIPVALALAVAGGCSNAGANKTPARTEAVRPPVAVDVAVITPAELAEGIDVVGLWRRSTRRT
jgi:hypothetical protein